MNVGENIRRIREDKGITQVWLAEKAGISQAMLCQIERGTKKPSLQIGVGLAKHLHHTPSAVSQRLYRMGLPKKNQRKQWTTKEVKRLREMYFEKHISIKEIAKALDIDYKKVYMKIYALEGEKQDEKINQKTAGRDVYREHR